MGCDIHAYREVCVGGVWIPAKACVDGAARESINRYYGLFGTLCSGVRGYKYPWSLMGKGLPDDISPRVRVEFEKWCGEAHSMSWATLGEIKDVWCEVDSLAADEIRDLTCTWVCGALSAVIALFDPTDGPEQLQRLVFWFDN